MICRLTAYLLAVGLLYLALPARADTITVCNTCEEKTVSGAVLRATNGDVIMVHDGRYEEGQINIDKRISLIGLGQPEMIGNNSSDLFLINSDSVIIRGFIIRDIGVSYINDIAAIKISEKSGCQIEGNQLHNTFFGIYLKNASDCIIKNNIILGNAELEVSSGNAIHIWYSKNILVQSNTCRNHRDGIYLEFADSCLIKTNLSEGNLRYGLHFMFSNHDIYQGNTFRHNGAGVAVMFSRFIKMYDNTFEKNWGPSSYGLLLKEIFDGEIAGNTFRQNTYGIYGDGSNRIIMQHNDFLSNGWAMKILGSCSSNTIRRNNFIGNTFDVITNSASNTNLYSQNYWSDYTGYDLDQDGIGDIPYQPVRLFSYITGNVPTSIILLRSALVDLLNFAEKVVPSITPGSLSDNQPLMKRIKR